MQEGAGAVGIDLAAVEGDMKGSLIAVGMGTLVERVVVGRRGSVEVGEGILLDLAAVVVGKTVALAKGRLPVG